MSICIKAPAGLARAVEHMECDPNCPVAPGDGHLIRDYLIRCTGMHRVGQQMRFRRLVEVRCLRCRNTASITESASMPVGEVVAAEETGELGAVPQIDPETGEQRRGSLVGVNQEWNLLEWIYKPRGKAPGKPPTRTKT